MSKLIDRKDIMTDIVTNIAPNFFDTNTIDQNRTSIYGYTVETMAKSIEDTVTLEQDRASDYCPELSTSIVRVKQTAEIRGVTFDLATPSHAYFTLTILKSDVIAKGELQTNGEIHFTIDRRSTITNNSIPFSLEDNILIRCIQKNGVYVFTANYAGTETTVDTSYVEMFESVDSEDEEVLALVIMAYQYVYNVQEKVVTDLLEFMYDGLIFDYNNKLVSFNVFYKLATSDIYTAINTEYYLADVIGTDFLFYNADDDNILYIIDNGGTALDVNATIKVEILETLGDSGNTTVGTAIPTFDLYKDSSYNYSGVSIGVAMLSAAEGGAAADTLAAIRKKLIYQKTRRDSITTQLDITNYIADEDANVQIIKKRNDIQDRIYYMYTLLRLNSNIAPTTTKKLIVTGPTSTPSGYNGTGDFDILDTASERRIIRANTKFRLYVDASDRDGDYANRVKSTDVIDTTGYYVACPYLLLIDKINVMSYYYPTVNETVRLASKSVSDVFPYEMIARDITIVRDAMSATTYDTYNFTVDGALNTSNEMGIIDITSGAIVNPDRIRGYLVFKRGGNDVAYAKLGITAYNATTRAFTFTGSIKTSDYITADNRLEITEGLYQVGTSDVYESVIDFSDGQFTLYFMYDSSVDAVVASGSGIEFSLFPSSITSQYVLMNTYYNTTSHYYNMIYEMNKFSRSPITIKHNTDGSYEYTIKEVPFIEYTYAQTNSLALYDVLSSMMVTYTDLVGLTTDFDVSLKFIATYGQSKYISVVGGVDANGVDITAPLEDLNPTLRFKVYGTNVSKEEVYTYIYEYLRDNFIIDSKIFISNICTEVESKINEVSSIKYLGVDGFDASYQEFVYNTPTMTDVDILKVYVPEQLNVSKILITIVET